MELIGIYVQELFHLIYPRLCLACRSKQQTKLHPFCLSCMAQFAHTEFHRREENPFTEHFKGRVWIEQGSALFYFSNGNPIQHLLHQFKYKKQKSLGIEFGKYHASFLKDILAYRGIDCIIPVPLHPRKEWERGFNQSWEYAKGLSTGLGKPAYKNILIRKTFTASQTNKTRKERMINMEQAFEVKGSEKLIGKHVLLVDDVLTTGATLEACALQLLTIKDIKISMATIAIGT